MSRPRSKAPTIRYHISGQSVVTLNGRDFYLGKHQSVESFARYAVLIRIYQENDCRLPDSLDMDEIGKMVVVPSSAEEAPQRQDLEPIQVQHVTQCFLKYTEESYKNQPKEIYRIKKLVADIEAHCGEIPVEQFGPIKLQELRQQWVDAELARVYCNKLTNHTARMFKHAVSQQLVTLEIWQRLKSVEPLRAGRTSAHETEEHVWIVGTCFTP